MSKKFIVSFDPGAGGDAFNSIISQYYNFYRASSFPARNNNIVYENPTNDLGILIKQMPLVFAENNTFGIEPYRSVFSLSDQEKDYVNFVIDQNFKRKMCLGTHWYNPDFSKFPLYDSVPLKLLSTGRYIPVFFCLLFLKNWDHEGHKPTDHEAMIRASMTKEQADEFLKMPRYRGWERTVYMFGVDIPSFKIKDAMKPLFEEYKRRFTVTEFSDQWNYIDIGDFWFGDRKDISVVEKVFDIKLDIGPVENWKNKNLQMIKEKFGLELSDYDNESWIEPVIEYFTRQYNE
jgi:hypothetical protein